MTPEEELRKEIKRKLLLRDIKRKYQANSPVDYTTGAPAKVRALVGGAPPEGRLATLQKFYPDAEQDIVDPSNFIFTNPETGKRTLYNPGGLDLGDIPSVGREAAGAVGSGIGATLGAPLGGIGIIGGAGAGGSLTEAGYDWAASQFGMVDPRTFEEKTEDYNYAAGLYGAGQAVGMAFNAGIRGAIRGGPASRREMAKTIDEFAEVGATPTLGQATNRHSYQVAETVFANIPGGSGVIAKKAEETLKKFESSVRQKASSLSPTGYVEDPESIGLRLNTGFDTWSDQFYAQGRQMERGWRETAKRFGPGANSDQPMMAWPGETLGYLGKDYLKYADYDSTQVLGSGTLRDLLGSLLKDIEKTPNGDVPIDVLQTIRTQVGNRLSRFRLDDDTSRKELRSLYEALTWDIRRSLPPQALAEFDKTKAFWHQGFQRVDNFLAGLSKKGIEPEKLFRTLETAGKEGATKLREVRGTVSTDDWKMFAAAVLERLGRPTPGEATYSHTFSIGTYLKEWGKLSENAKEAMFGGLPGFSELRRDLDTIFKVGSRIDESGAIWVNPSGTARVAGAITGVVGTGAALSGSTALLEALGKGVVSGWALSKLMVNPKFVNWLAKSSTMQPNEFASHIGRLEAAYQSTNDGDLKEAMKLFVSGLRDVTAGVPQQQ